MWSKNQLQILSCNRPLFAFKNLIHVQRPDQNKEEKKWLKVIKAQIFSAVSNLISRGKRKGISPLNPGILLVRYGGKAEAVQRQGLSLLSVSLCKSIGISFVLISECGCWQPDQRRSIRQQHSLWERKSNNFLIHWPGKRVQIILHLLSGHLFTCKIFTKRCCF